MKYKKRKKSLRLRAKTTHGYGSMKKNRGAGNRGGVGNAGTGKRAATNKPKVWKNPKYFGKHGFTIHRQTVIINPINLKDLEAMSDKLIIDKKIEEKDGVFLVDLSKLGYNKLLGTGKVTKKYIITTEQSSAGAVEKVKGAGGDVILPSVDASEEVKVDK
jgi:large subunit ribosomal protein L15